MANFQKRLDEKFKTVDKKNCPLSKMGQFFSADPKKWEIDQTIGRPIGQETYQNHMDVPFFCEIDPIILMSVSLLDPRWRPNHCSPQVVPKYSPNIPHLTRIFGRWSPHTRGGGRTTCCIPQVFPKYAPSIPHLTRIFGRWSPQTRGGGRTTAAAWIPFVFAIAEV